MGINEERGLEVRVIEEATNRGIKAYRLALTNPSELEFTWFERGGKEEVVKKQKAEALWKKYNPILKEKTRQFSQFIEEGAFLKEIADIFEIDYTTARSWKETTAKYCNVKPLLRRKGPRQIGPWHSIPIDLISYMLYCYMPKIEGWKIAYDVAKDNDVSMATILNMCKEPGIEIIERKKTFISPLGERVIVERLGQKKVKQYVIRQGGKDYYSIAYASREATAQKGFKEGTEAFEIEAGTRYKRMLWTVAHCLSVKHEDIKGSHYVDRENLRLLWDVITVEEASQIGSLSEREIKVRMDEGILPVLPSDKTDFTLRSAVLKLKGVQEGKKEVGETELETKYSSLLETNQLLSTRLEQTTEELRKAQSEISEIRDQVSTYKKGRLTQKQLGEYVQLESRVTSLQKETNRQKKAIDQLEKRGQSLQNKLAEAQTYKRAAQQLETRISKLQAQMAEAEALKKEIFDTNQRLTNECTALRARAEMAEKTYSQLQEQLKGYAKLESQLDSLQTMVKIQKATINQYKQRINQYKQRIDEFGTQLKEARKNKERAEQLRAILNKLETKVTDYEKLKSTQKKLSEEIADLRKQRTDTQKYDVQIKELTEQLTVAKSTIKEKQQVLEKQDRMIEEWRRRYSAETKEYFSQLAGQVGIIEQALSEGKPPEENQIADLRSYLIRAKQFQPQTTPPHSDCLPAVVAQSTTTFPVSDVLIWYGKWCESKEQRFVANLTKYFNSLASELRERCEKI